MTFQTIRYDVTDGLAVVTLNRPEKLNAYNMTMQSELMAVLDRIDSDDAVRAVIFTGEGRAFCAGADLSSGAKTFDYAKRTDLQTDDALLADGRLDPDSDAARDGGGMLTLRIFNCLKPMIAAVNGPAVGIGASMLLAMDVRIASQSASFGFVFTRRGIVPDGASSWFLSRMVGISRALEWCLGGRVVSATEALAAGLVKSLHAPTEVLEAARALATEISIDSAPVSVALTRRLLWRGLGYDHPMEAHRLESRAILSRGRSNDAREGVTSFLEKRPAHFTDKVSESLPELLQWWKEPRYRE